MKTIQITDEAYEALKTFIVDPFDDSPEQVIVRLMDIVNKARQRWSPFETPVEKSSSSKHDKVPNGTRVPDQALEDSAVML